MKRAIIGGFISLIGSIWTLAVIISANNYPIDGWSTPPGKLLMQITESGIYLSRYLIWCVYFAPRNYSRVNFHVCKEKDFKRLNKSEFDKGVIV